MNTVTPLARGRKHAFRDVAEPFLQREGLPFAQVLSEQAIEEAFVQHGGLFAQDEVFSTPVVLWGFLAQALQDGKHRACSAAVESIIAYKQQRGEEVPSGDTGDYCRARAKLSLAALQQLVRQSAQQLEDQADASWLWHGLHAKVIDGFTFTMPDTADNQDGFPQPTFQPPGTGLPMARACVMLSLATAAVEDINIGPFEGKETGESALLRGMLERLGSGDVAVFDRYCCSYMMIAMLQLRGAHACTRLHQCRSEDFTRGTRLGEDDYLVTWTRPQRPDWMDRETYEQIPLTLTLRMIRYQVVEPGYRTQTITVVTTLTDPQRWSKEDIAELYRFRWNAELDIRHIKQTLGLDHFRCKSPHMVLRELWVTLLGYNLIRKLTATAAALHGKQPRQLGFTLACQTIMANYMLASTGVCRDPRAFWELALERIAVNEVANRPGRIEPRAVKRWRDRFPRMHQPREEMRNKLRAAKAARDN
jgi:hypothetical protein